MLLHVPQTFTSVPVTVKISIGDTLLTTWKGIPGKRVLRLPFELKLAPAVYHTEAEIITENNKKYSASSDLVILDSKPNEVKSDRFTGGLIADGRPFLPFGFYCYSPVNPALPEEEAVKGFNMISPYQVILPETLSERKAYMDRCARLGLKVHYNLLSVSGGGGVGSMIEGITDEEKHNRLAGEIKAFMDHPALLAWYISDEPNGRDLSPEKLISVYNTVKELDPWHPVSIVFMAPFMSSRKYSDAMDIVMADPYPVPGSSITMVGTITSQLRNEFNGRKSVWIVPQAFGGGELWEREPTIQEVRSMTYQAIVNGARGIQYFVREGLNLFPKSTATWGECGRMATEISQITPWLLSDEEPLPVRSSSGNIQVTSALHDGQLLILAVNKANIPQSTTISVQGISGGKARVIFENREISLRSGIISDILPAYGSQAYLIRIKPVDRELKPFPGNLLRDPGFEDISSPGVPSSCYAWNLGDRGATFFLDPGEHLEGNFSLRLVTPEENKSARLRFFPVKIEKGKTYIVTIWAKADTGYHRSLGKMAGTDDPEKGVITPQYFEVGLGTFGKTRFEPGNEWKQYVASFEILLSDEVPAKANVILSLPGAGIAWFDMIQVFEAAVLKRRSIDPELSGILYY